MGYVVARHRAFASDFANSCHDWSPNFKLKNRLIKGAARLCARRCVSGVLPCAGNWFYLRKLAIIQACALFGKGLFFRLPYSLLVGLLSWYIRLVCVCIDACTVSGCLKTRNVRGLPRVTRKPAPAPLPKPPTPKWHPPFRAGRKHRTLFPLPPSAVLLFPAVLRRRIRRV